MRLPLAALVTSIGPFAAAGLVLLLSAAFPIVDHVRDMRAAAAIAVLSLGAFATWPVGLGASIFAVRGAEAGAPRTVARAALVVSVLGGVALGISCVLLAILVAGLSMH